MAFSAATTMEDALAVCALSGQLDSRAAAAFERQLATDLAQGPKCLLVDCGALEFITSAGLRVLLMLGKRLDAEGGRLALCALNPATRQVFDIAGFSSIFPIHPTRAAAAEWLLAAGRSNRAAHMARSLLRSAAPAGHRRAAAASDVERAAFAAELLDPRRRDRP